MGKLSGKNQGICFTKLSGHPDTYIHTHIHTYIHTYIHTHTHIHTYIHTYIHTHTQTYTHTHRRMRRGGRGAAAPLAFGQLSFLGSGGPFFGQQQWWEGGVFQFSGGRMTSRGQCPRGGGGACECPRGGGGVFQFSGGRMTSRRQCPRGGGVLVKSPIQEILYPRLLCKILGNQPLRPP